MLCSALGMQTRPHRGHKGCHLLDGDLACLCPALSNEALSQTHVHSLILSGPLSLCECVCVCVCVCVGVCRCMCVCVGVCVFVFNAPHGIGSQWGRGSNVMVDYRERKSTLLNYRHT